MGRKNLAEKIYYAIEPDTDSEDTWIVTYDFNSKANSKFWLNLHRLSMYAPGSRLLQQSVYSTQSRRVARAAVSLARHYGASVHLFRCVSAESIEGAEA